MDYESREEEDDMMGAASVSEPAYAGGDGASGAGGHDEEREDPWQSLRKATEVRTPLH